VRCCQLVSVMSVCSVDVQPSEAASGAVMVDTSSLPATQLKFVSELGQPLPTYSTVSSVLPMPHVVAVSVPPGMNDSPRSPTMICLAPVLMEYAGETETAPVPGHVVAPVPMRFGLAGSMMMSAELLKPLKVRCTAGRVHEAAPGMLEVGDGVSEGVAVGDAVSVGVGVSAAEGDGSAPVDKDAVGLDVTVAVAEAVGEGGV